MESQDTEKKRGRKGIWTALILCAALGLFMWTASALRRPDSQAATPDGTSEPGAELSVTELIKAVKTLKDDLEGVVDGIKEEDLVSAKQKVDGLPQKIAAIRLSLDKTIASLGDGMSGIRAQLMNIQGLLDLTEEASEKLLGPAIYELAENPITSLGMGEGVNTRPLCSYLDFLEERMPDIADIIARAENLDLSIVDDDGELAGYLQKGKKLLALYGQDPSLIDSIKSFLGADGDRLYLLAAQNSSEIRASGGFPGAVGTIRIRDGILTLGDFNRVYDVFSPYTPGEANITPTETALFHDGLSNPRDADYCPDFPRVAYIWSLGYETKMGEPVHGVISATPVIVQKLLKAMDAEITLFDGTVLNGDNGVKVLQYELYYKYFGKDYVSDRDTISDQLFADAAKKTAQKLMENMRIENLMAYASVAETCFQDRTLMVWTKDPVLQNAIAELGWSGSLNRDPKKPQVGVYVNCTVPSKMGWFLSADTQIGKPLQNEDGSQTYDVSVKLSNHMTSEELQSASAYITGGNKGAFRGSAYFFAPAGGSISDFAADNGSSIAQNEYQGLQLGYLQSLNVNPGQTVEVTFRITTAPGTEEPLAISQTPTLQAYH